ncbi:MAG: RHS repeat domain-containing protein [Gemmatimonadaceae bacterium]
MAKHLNTPRLVADAAGTTVWRWDQQEPFGNNPANDDPDGNSVAFDLPLRLPGQRYDTETGLHYNYFRDYDPSVGRYEEGDPIGLKGRLNIYAYVFGRPLDRIDTVGLEGEIPNVGQSCFLSCMAVTTYHCIRQPEIGLTMCAACLLLRSPPVVKACLAGCTRNPTAVCVAVATVGCTAACAIADLCFRRYAN